MIGDISNGLPLVCARYIFAGNTAISRRIKPQLARYLVLLKINIIPRSISKAPLI
jgi:hypothetical protein